MHEQERSELQAVVRKDVGAAMHLLDRVLDGLDDGDPYAADHLQDAIKLAGYAAGNLSYCRDREFEAAQEAYERSEDLKIEAHRGN